MRTRAHMTNYNPMPETVYDYEARLINVRVLRRTQKGISVQSNTVWKWIKERHPTWHELDWEKVFQRVAVVAALMLVLATAPGYAKEKRPVQPAMQATEIAETVAMVMVFEHDCHTPSPEARKLVAEVEPMIVPELRGAILKVKQEEMHAGQEQWCKTVAEEMNW